VPAVSVPRTVPELLGGRVRVSPAAPAYFVPAGSKIWQPCTWRDLAERVAHRAQGLRLHGTGRGTRVAIVARTCLDWEITQLAALSLGAVVAGIDPQYPADTMTAVLSDVLPEVLVVEDDAVLARIPRPFLTRAKLVLSLARSSGSDIVPAVGLDQFAPSDPIGEVSVSPEDPALVAFSSGTTATPKAVVYRHEQVLLAVRSITEMFPELGPESVLVAWLPLANLFQRIMNLCAIQFGASTYVVEDPRAIMERVREINPHMLIGVPRFFEKVNRAVTRRLESHSTVTRLVSRALAANRRRRLGEAGGIAAVEAKLLDRVALSPLRNAFGRRCRFLVSGSAPMPAPLLDWYESLGLPVLEAYGVSENIVPIAFNTPSDRRLGSVGRPLPANEVSLSADGEVLVQGRGVYTLRLEAGELVPASRPDKEDLATGDLGSIDADGYLALTGRKRDVFKLSSGRWVAPARVEAAMQQAEDIDQAVVFGANRKATVAVIALRERGDAAKADRLRRQVDEALAALPEFMRPAAIIVATRGFSIDDGDLTVNMKLRRASIGRRFEVPLRRAFAAIEAGQPVEVQFV